MTFKPEQLTAAVSLYAGDCLDVLKTLDANSVDSCVTDPPYHLTSIVKRFGAANAAPAKVGKTGAYARASAGFMGKVWDGGDIAFRPELWAEVYRVLKPGAHLVAFGGTRTYHRMACAIEDAGFEIRDSIQWLYASGFPKSHDVSKGIDRAAGAEREIVGPSQYAARGRRTDNAVYGEATPSDREVVTLAATDAARQWAGFGTALKPACEPIVLARKPLGESTVAANVLKWGTGALNIDGCRVGYENDAADPATNPLHRLQGGYKHAGNDDSGSNNYSVKGRGEPSTAHTQGRWPANVIHDGSNEVVGAFPDAPGQQQNIDAHAPSPKTGNIYGKMNREGEASAERRYTENGGTNFAALPGQRRNDSGSAARFFYTAKADADDRLGSKHPTVKPLDLMQYLVRLVTPARGLVLDPFAGTGTTGEAAIREGSRAILIERETEYQDDIRRRMKLAMSGPDERAREAIKAKLKGKPVDHGPLFSEYDPQKDFSASLDEAYTEIKQRVAAGGPGWEPSR